MEDPTSYMLKSSSRCGRNMRRTKEVRCENEKVFNHPWLPPPQIKYTPTILTPITGKKRPYWSRSNT
eukprot:6435382-Ditylum_brightwellii.AAC.1